MMLARGRRESASSSFFILFSMWHMNPCWCLYNPILCYWCVFWSMRGFELNMLDYEHLQLSKTTCLRCVSNHPFKGICMHISFFFARQLVNTLSPNKPTRNIDTKTCWFDCHKNILKSKTLLLLLNCNM